MPFVKLDVIEGRSDAEIASLLEAAHRAVVNAFDVPERDRYQVVAEHKPGRLIALDTGLGIARTDKVVIVTVTSRPRAEDHKKRFYRMLCDELRERCGIQASDVIVSITENTDADWSFGHGRAQFLTGEL
jgi:phenylpyruvate tautomerase PptA (4-oxalocrotonate tautomerase family)